MVSFLIHILFLNLRIYFLAALVPGAVSGLSLVAGGGASSLVPVLPTAVAPRVAEHRL